MPQNIYPPPDVREQIIAQRDQIMQELIRVFVSTPQEKHPLGIQKLGARYGMSEVSLVLDAASDLAHLPEGMANPRPLNSDLNRRPP